MLNVPTLWTVFVINFLSLGLVWTYVTFTYPKFEPARFWASAALAAACGTGLALLRYVSDSLAPLLVGGTILIFAATLAEMGVRRFYDRSISWLGSALLCGATFAGVVFFIVVYDDAPMRILVYSIGQSIPLARTLGMLLTPRNGRINSGARLAGLMSIVILVLYALRAINSVLNIDGEFSFVHFNPLQSVVVLAMVFLSSAWNFGFLLMAIDRLRDEIGDLALMDDLTGVGNRRHLLLRLAEECAKSERSGRPFALLVIDLDGFKTINDTHGHAAGDACLQHFTLMAQTRLRPGDMLARTGGDEFCVLLPSSSLSEGAGIARRIIEVCRNDAANCIGGDIPISVSVGVAQWTSEIGVFPDQLIAAADHALYAAKNSGKNRLAVHDPAPPLVPLDSRSATGRSLRSHA